MVLGFLCVLFIISDNRTSKQFVARTLHLLLVGVVMVSAVVVTTVAICRR